MFWRWKKIYTIWSYDQYWLLESQKIEKKAKQAHWVPFWNNRLHLLTKTRKSKMAKEWFKWNNKMVKILTIWALPGFSCEDRDVQWEFCANALNICLIWLMRCKSIAQRTYNKRLFHLIDYTTPLLICWALFYTRLCKVKIF